MGSLEEHVLEVADQLEKRNNVQPAAVAKALRKAVCEQKWDHLSELHRGVVFGICAMTPTQGGWPELPVEVQDTIGMNLRSWLPLVEGQVLPRNGALKGPTGQVVLAR